MGSPRDYYADLELPPTADIQEIKKQFRKLALKYHPDRNPGREQEVNSKFQIIQAAHEILSDPQQKEKYDATIRQSSYSRFPASSGVRGNPWQNVSQQFPTPPRRNPQPRNPTSGAQRWSERFSSGVPPTAKQQASTNPSNTARAFESMRKGGAKPGQQEARPSTRPPPPSPPPPPRTEAAKKRAEASFGARKTGYYPRSAMPGDEPPVSNNNYSSRVNTERPQPVPDPLAKFREKERERENPDEGFADSRQSSPYTTQGGEKTNPFDGIPLGRAKSAREPPRREEPSKPEGCYPNSTNRSSSVPGGEAREEAESDNDTRRDNGRKRAVPVPPSSRVKTSFKSGAGVESNPTDPFAPNQTTERPTAESSHSSGYQTSSKTPVNGAGGPSMYGTPEHNKKPHIKACTTNTVKMPNNPLSNRHPAEVGCTKDRHALEVPSGIYKTYLTPFERQQRVLLDQLIKNQRKDLLLNKEPRHSITSSHDPNAKKVNANILFTHSFNFNLDEDTFSPSSPETSRFNRSSFDDINTKFTNGENPTAWQFSAGSGEPDSYPTSRSQSGSRTGRRSPAKRPPLRRVDIPDPATQSAQSPAGFDADGWSDKFGPQTFVPQPTPNAPVSPSRPNRTNSRKAKTTKPTVGNAAVVDGSSSDEDSYEWRGRKAHQKAAAVDSPQAMDIDPPQAAPAEPSPKRQPSSARNIPVEPTRPEWRPGNVDGVHPEPEQAQKTNDNPANAKGSEDCEEFRATLADLKNVAPFAEQNSGLKSLNDLKDTLPFESQASNEGPVKAPQAYPLVFPTPPVAPRLPPTVAVEGIKPNVASWSKYIEEFESYLRHWDSFNSQVVDHFATRKSNISRARASKGYTFLGARGDGDILEYHNWVLQDNDVRKRWQEACDEHEHRFREYMAFRERMK